MHGTPFRDETTRSAMLIFHDFSLQYLDVFFLGIYKEKLDIGSDSYEGICNKLRETCVDPFFEDRYWRIDKIELIKNKRLENGYNEMKAAMGYEVGRHHGNISHYGNISVLIKLSSYTIPDNEFFGPSCRQFSITS